MRDIGEAMLTTQEGADILNVPHSYLISLLEKGELAGWIKAEDLFAYKRARDKERSEALDELARLGQEFDAA